VWEFELFAVEDTTVVDGQPITISRGVTVGKSVGALLPVPARLLGHRPPRPARRAVDGAERPERRARAHVPPLDVAVMSFALVLLTLNLARIPLSVFAFLGGALAIGVGFGTQTIIKNFISGMILLVERRVQIGDVIEIDGVEGTVTTVDLRSSTVRAATAGDARSQLGAARAQGVQLDALGPQDPPQRAVGVAYGTLDARRGGEDRGLREAARQRAQQPASAGAVRGFADSAQILTLYFWVESRTR
jgi:hypothetical protein